ncbi:MAG TPA: hypothetical protein PLM07_07635 [Candidatus Rifleibacterium sp.]|nr:hypothetical protein [Candidatus Rifleibacterium sp.]HPT45756.1 hypothetical protein [Candidatus Rifleibacterium sp.]
MNRIVTNLAATLIAIAVFFFLGRLFFLSGLQSELNQAYLKLEDSKSKYEQVNAELAQIKPTAESHEESLKKAPLIEKLLKPAEEASLLRVISDSAGKSFRINSFDLIESFMLKPELADEASGGSPAFTGNPEQLAPLDDQGMPIGSSSDADEEWPGIEIIPVRITFSSTFRTLGKFLSEAGQSLPLNTVRSLDIILREEGLIKGTLVMNFPMAESQ